ncbi:MAG TPA: hypothetical protein VFM97_00635 [Gammaproteobacteria bacterium]|nr:hypothetical protein [Gammaproteobacteria bacterium]
MLRARTAVRSYKDADLVAPVRAGAREQGGPPRTLIIGIDAVPYTLVRQMTGGSSLFEDFQGPAALNSTFPSISYTAWSSLLEPLGSTRPLGYETRYFDSTSKKLKGGLSLAEVPASWKETFDWKLHGLVRTAVAYGLPRRYSIWELKHGLQAFAESPSAIFSMYIVSTDGLAHLSGPDGLAEVLQAVDTQVKAFKVRHPDMPFNTILLSDHGIAGGEPLVNIWPAVRSAVKQAGFRVRHRLVGAHDVVFNPYGLVTNLVAYAAPGAATALAEVFAQVPGVDLAVICAGASAWRLCSSRGRALIERRPGHAGCVWRYREEDGDPLGYAPVVAALKRRAHDATAEWFPDRWWFEATRRSFYPDALHRLAQSFDLTDTPPAVICSCTPGYMFGGLKTEYISRATVGRLRWTHGALHRDASLGFMMTDLPEWEAPEMVRAEEALTCLTASEAEAAAVADLNEA